MINYFVVFVMFLSINTFADEPIKLVLEKNDDIGLFLYLKNVSEKSVLINKRFALGSSVAPSEVELVIFNKNGNFFPFQVKINLRPPSKEDLFLLEPGQHIGKEFSFDEIISYYDLTSGEYRVQAMYKHVPIYDNKLPSDKNVYSGLLTSNRVTFEVK